MCGEVVSAKPPFFSGWTSGATGHWGIDVDFRYSVTDSAHRNTINIYTLLSRSKIKWINCDFSPLLLSLQHQVGSNFDLSSISIFDLGSLSTGNLLSACFTHMHIFIVGWFVS